MLNGNIWSWVGVGVSVFLEFFFGVCVAAPTAYNRNSKFKWHNEQMYAIHL